MSLQGMDYVYVNSGVKNNTNEFIDAVSSTDRNGEILGNSLVKGGKWSLSVDRFFINGARLPLFKKEGDYNITITDNGGNTETQAVVFTVDSKGFLYDYHVFAENITSCIDSICVALGIAGADRPIMTYDDVTNLFTINSTAAFRATWDLLIDNNLYYCLHTFRTDPIGDNYEIILLADDESQHSTSIENISPVSRILLVGNGIPINGELIPGNIDVTDIGTGLSSNTLKIITDFKYYQESNSELNNIIYNADYHRWKTLLRYDNFTQFEISFYWGDKSNNLYRLQLAKQKGSAEAKLVFASTAPKF